MKEGAKKWGKWNNLLLMWTDEFYFENNKEFVEEIKLSLLSAAAYLGEKSLDTVMQQLSTPRRGNNFQHSSGQ